MFFFWSRDTTIINHSPCHSSNNSFNEDLPVADHRNQEMENRCIPTIYQPPFWFQTSLQDLPLFFSSTVWLPAFWHVFSALHQDPCPLCSDFGKRRRDQNPQPAAAPGPGSKGRAKSTWKPPECSGGNPPICLLHSLHQPHKEQH